MLATVRGIFRIILLALVILPCMTLQFFFLWLPRPYFYFFPALLSKGVLWALGVKLDIRGTPSTETPTLFLSNHSCYMDITILQALLPVSFISKAEVARWPLFGQLALLEGCIFIDRTNRGDTKNQTERIARRLSSGGNLVLFPEGTTGDGTRILPLKSSLLGVATMAKAVQPITIAFTALDGIPPGRTFRYYYAWIGDEDMPPHMWRILTSGDMTLTVTFHEPIRDGLDNRKALAGRVEGVMRQGLSNALSQRAA